MIVQECPPRCGFCGYIGPSSLHSEIQTQFTVRTRGGNSYCPSRRD